MVTLRELADNALDLRVESFDAAVVTATATATGSRFKPRFAGKFQLPPNEASDWVQLASQQAEAVLPGQGPSLVATLIDRPYRVYELHAPSDCRAIAIIGSYRRHESRDIYVAVARLHAQTDGTRKIVSSGPLELALVPLADTSLTRKALEDLAGDLSDGEWSNLKGKGASVVVGGSATQPAPGWQRQIGAVLWSYGYRINRVLEEPWRYEARVNSQLSKQDADLYIFLREWNVDGGGKDHTDDLIRVVSNKPVIDTEDVDSLPEVLDVVRLHLTDAGVDVPDPPQEQLVLQIATAIVPEPTTWQEVHDGLSVLESPAFVITDSARAGCLDCEYLHPPRMWDAMQQLRDAAVAWVAADCSVGDRFEDWVRENFGLRVALHDDAIAADARSRFEYDGETYSRIPHVQLDQAKSFNEIGRIHFALDDQGRRIIVDHIGLKLLGRDAAT